ncbi:tRNA wybutosine-synthesizing protein 5-like isoform X1 [Acanthaster planci]|uniref:tRNA wybutosine-synthesizing protein 5-like isoform X1 n=1 Tax=Acanthaster planci TaxID=133434 RepID=A0A8B8A2G2_ACAPL|nr:tRNA wybutosine-synthesizing protein 5-like isoform X1 [Acanthaster planci]
MTENVYIFETVDKDFFMSEVYPQRKPAVLRGIDIGDCTSRWTEGYLCEKVGSQEVKVHVSPTAKMDFISKNYAYRTLPFDIFVRRAAEHTHDEFFFKPDEKYYFRALGGDPRKEPADLTKQFPTLAADVAIPRYFKEGAFFSSVLRLGSAGVQLWTHYDIMDNLLIQISGHKRVVLFRPSDATHLYLTGDKSAVLDIDNPDLVRYPAFRHARPIECHLQPGDVLFIPALWFHNVQSLDFSVAVNVFFRHLDASCYDNKDPYGNKDPQAAARALQILNRAVKCLEELPEEYRDFYGRRMINEIEAKTFLNS